MHNRSIAIAVLVIIALLTTACGGDSPLDEVRAATDDAGSADSGSSESAAPSGGAGASGLATMIIGGTTYEFSGSDCLAVPGEGFDDEYDFRLQGVGQVGGQEFYGAVQRRVVDMNSDGEDDILHSVVIEVGVGRAQQQAPAGQPSLLMQVVEEEGDRSIVYEPGRLNGRGSLMDRNSVLANEADEIPFTFVATCT